MVVKGLEPGAFYWAVPKNNNGSATIVQVSTMFGEDPEYWTLALVGSEQHQMPGDFDIIARIDDPRPRMRQAAE
jgi:hypothetical protein